MRKSFLLLDQTDKDAEKEQKRFHYSDSLFRIQHCLRALVEGPKVVTLQIDLRSEKLIFR